MILTNPVVIAVIVLLVMCFLRVNVLLALVIASVVAGLVSGMDIGTTIDTFITGCGTDPETAVAYVLLGGLAAAISYTGVSDTTLAPTAGLNADGQHDHIWDTCVPTFIASDIPIFILACLSPLFF